MQLWDNFFCSDWGHHLIVVGQFACISEPSSYVVGSLALVVGSPMTNWSKGRDLTESDPLVLQVGGWTQG